MCSESTQLTTSFLLTVDLSILAVYSVRSQGSEGDCGRQESISLPYPRGCGEVASACPLLVPCVSLLLCLGDFSSSFHCSFGGHTPVDFSMDVDVENPERCFQGHGFFEMVYLVHWRSPMLEMSNARKVFEAGQTKPKSQSALGTSASFVPCGWVLVTAGEKEKERFDVFPPPCPLLHIIPTFCAVPCSVTGNRGLLPPFLQLDARDSVAPLVGLSTGKKRWRG